MKIALDVDGVLANFYLEFCRMHSKPYEAIDVWNLDWISELIHTVNEDDEFWERLPLISHPESISFDFDYYITTIPNNIINARKNWLYNHNFPDKPIIPSYDKLSTMMELGVEILIDDKYPTIKEIHDAGFLGIHFIPYYLKPKNISHYNIRHLSEANGIIEAYRADKLNKIVNGEDMG